MDTPYTVELMPDQARTLARFAEYDGNSPEDELVRLFVNGIGTTCRHLRRFRTHGDPCCQEGMANSPGGLARGRRAGRDCDRGFSSSLRFWCRRAARGQAGAPAAPRRQARARTNELDPGKRRPMIRSEEEPSLG